MTVGAYHRLVGDGGDLEGSKVGSRHRHVEKDWVGCEEERNEKKENPPRSIK